MSPRPIPGEPLIPGESYLVPTVYGMVVVDAPPHVDNDYLISSPDLHEHVDARFYNPGDKDLRIVYPAGRTECNMVCRQPFPESLDVHEVGLLQIGLYLAFGKRSLINGRCPHHGAPVSGGVCPSHALQWDEDGTCLYKPPFTLRIEGTKNEHICETWTGKIRFKITESFEMAVNILMFDRDNLLIARAAIDERNPPKLLKLVAGDTLILGQGQQKQKPGGV